MKAEKIKLSAKVRKVKTQLAIDFGDSGVFENIRPFAFITSEANIHGAMKNIFGDWYDGKVNKIEIGRNEKEIHTSQVYETVRVSDSCSKKTYYETLTERYFTKNFSSSNLSSF